MTTFSGCAATTIASGSRGHQARHVPMCIAHRRGSPAKIRSECRRSGLRAWSLEASVRAPPRTMRSGLGRPRSVARARLARSSRRRVRRRRTARSTRIRARELDDAFDALERRPANPAFAATTRSLVRLRRPSDGERAAGGEGVCSAGSRFGLGAYAHFGLRVAGDALAKSSTGSKMDLGGAARAPAPRCAAEHGLGSGACRDEGHRVARPVDGPAAGARARRATRMSDRILVGPARERSSSIARQAAGCLAPSRTRASDELRRPRSSRRHALGRDVERRGARRPFLFLGISVLLLSIGIWGGRRARDGERSAYSRWSSRCGASSKPNEPVGHLRDSGTSVGSPRAKTRRRARRP